VTSGRTLRAAAWWSAGDRRRRRRESVLSYIGAVAPDTAARVLYWERLPRRRVHLPNERPEQPIRH
jgi:hypothetical protein